MRLFVYCRLGSVFVWTINSSVSFTLAITKSGYLGGSTVNQINIWPEKNIIFMTSVIALHYQLRQATYNPPPPHRQNSWWSKTLKYDTLEDINSAIPGILGYFQKEMSLQVVYDVSNLGHHRRASIWNVFPLRWHRSLAAPRRGLGVLGWFECESLLRQCAHNAC